MIPLRDTVPSRRRPVVTYSLIGLSTLVFLLELSPAAGGEEFFRSFGVIPQRVSPLFHGRIPDPDALFSLVSSIFVHGGWLHLLGNMLFLHVFGDNVEDRLGRGGYFAFYLLGGFGASLTEVFFNPASGIPLVGASGAIAAVMGAYFILFPRARVLTVVPLVFLFPVVEVSAFFFLGFWFLLQFVQGSLGGGTAATGGVAWWAHAGGFVTGAALLPLFLLLRRVR